jgi:hypothetical protein
VKCVGGVALAVVGGAVGIVAGGIRAAAHQAKAAASDRGQRQCKSHQVNPPVSFSVL